jgi:hypothetical protein
MWAGVILSPTKKSGEEFKRAMGLKYWYIATPDTLLDGRSRSVTCEPRIFAVSDPGHEPMSTTILQYANYLVDLCDGRMPEVWHVRKAGT